MPKLRARQGGRALLTTLGKWGIRAAVTLISQFNERL